MYTIMLSAVLVSSFGVLSDSLCEQISTFLRAYDKKDTVLTYQSIRRELILRHDTLPTGQVRRDVEEYIQQKIEGTSPMSEQAGKLVQYVCKIKRGLFLDRKLAQCVVETGLDYSALDQTVEVALFLDVSQSCHAVETLLDMVAKRPGSVVRVGTRIPIFLFGNAVRGFDPCDRVRCTDTQTRLVDLFRWFGQDRREDEPRACYELKDRKVKLAIILTDGIWSEESDNSCVVLNGENLARADSSFENSVRLFESANELVVLLPVFLQKGPRDTTRYYRGRLWQRLCPRLDLSDTALTVRVWQYRDPAVLVARVREAIDRLLAMLCTAEPFVLDFSATGESTTICIYPPYWCNSELPKKKLGPFAVERDGRFVQLSAVTPWLLSAAARCTTHIFSLPGMEALGIRLNGKSRQMKAISGKKEIAVTYRPGRREVVALVSSDPGGDLLRGAMALSEAARVGRTGAEQSIFTDIGGSPSFMSFDLRRLSLITVDHDRANSRIDISTSSNDYIIPDCDRAIVVLTILFLAAVYCVSATVRLRRCPTWQPPRLLALAELVVLGWWSVVIVGSFARPRGIPAAMLFLLVLFASALATHFWLRQLGSLKRLALKRVPARWMWLVYPLLFVIPLLPMVWPLSLLWCLGRGQVVSFPTQFWGVIIFLLVSIVMAAASSALEKLPQKGNKGPSSTSEPTDGSDGVTGAGPNASEQSRR